MVSICKVPVRVMLFPLAALFSYLSIGAAPAHAAGPTKLKQPKAFPITIAQPGSYVLVSNLTVPDANTTAISVTADEVTIDLNGYSIVGPTICSGSPHVSGCSPVGSGVGIDSSGKIGTTVLNGSVRGMGSNGIVISDGSVHRVKAISNGGNGISVPTPSSSVYFGTMVTDSIANSNGGDGIYYIASVIDSTASFNLGTGISAEAVVSRCAAQSNGQVGIGTYNNLGTVANSTAAYNGTIGISAYQVTDSEATTNGDKGIAASAATGCAVTNNTGTPELSAVGIAGHNLCEGTPCP
jgi:hypothetical protein